MVRFILRLLSIKSIVYLLDLGPIINLVVPTRRTHKKRGTAMPCSKSEVVGIPFIREYGNSSPRIT